MNFGISPLKHKILDRPKKTTVGYGLLLIGMQRDLSTSLLVIGHQKQGNNYGKALKIKG